MFRDRDTGVWVPAEDTVVVIDSLGEIGKRECEIPCLPHTFAVPCVAEAANILLQEVRLSRVGEVCVCRERQLA